MATFTERMIGAARLEVPIYEEVEHDAHATGQALIIVVLASVSAGIGAGIAIGPGTLIMGTIGSLVGGCAWGLRRSAVRRAKALVLVAGGGRSHPSRPMWAGHRCPRCRRLHTPRSRG